MLQGIFACFNVLSSSMSSSVAKEDSTEKPGGLASLEANVKVKKDFVFTKEEVLDWLGQALLRFASSTWTSKSTDEILYCAVDVSQAAKWTKTFDVCEKSRAMLSELFTIRALEMVEQTQDKSKLQTFARQVVALAKLNCGTARAKTMYPCKYKDIFEACPDLCQSFQDFTYTKDEALESLADAIVCFCASRPDSDDFLFLAVKVSQAVILVNTLDLCDTISNMLAHFKTKEALAVVQQHQGDANFNKLVERAEEEAMSKAKADRWTKHKGHPNHSRTDLFVKKQPLSEEPSAPPIGSGLVCLEVTVKAMRLDPDFVLTKDEVLVWLGRAIDGFKCNTSRDEDEMLYRAVNVGLAAKLAETFALCEPSSLLLAELSITKALLIVEKTQDLSKIERLSNKAASSAISKAGVDRCVAKCPRMYDAKRANLVAACQSLQDFRYTKEEALESLARAIVWFGSSPSSKSGDLLFLAVKVNQAVALVNTFDLCDTTSNMLSRFETKQALALVQQHKDDANFEKLVERAESEAKLKATADRLTAHKHSHTDIFVKKQPLAKEQVVSQESASKAGKEDQVAKYPRKYEAKHLQDFTYTKDEALTSLADALVWFVTSRRNSDDFLFLAVKVNQAVILVNTFDLCDITSNMLANFKTKEALAVVQQHRGDANFNELVERAEEEAVLKAKAVRLAAHKHSHTDLFVKKQPLVKEQVVSQESSSKTSKEEQVEAKRVNLVGVYQNLQDFTYTKDEALERLARAIVRFGTAWPISGDLDLLFLAVQVSQAVTLVNTFALCDTSSNMLSRSETKEALAVVQKHKDDANFEKLVERAEFEAKLKAKADRLNSRKGDDRHFYTDHFVEKRHLSKEQPTSSKASGVVSFDDFAFSKAEALEWLARSIVKFGLSLGIPSKQPKLEWRAVSLVEASLAVRAFEPCEKTTKVLQHKHVKDAQLLVDQIQDAAKLDGLRNAVTLEEKCIVSAFRTTCQPTNYLRLLV